MNYNKIVDSIKKIIDKAQEIGKNRDRFSINCALKRALSLPMIMRINSRSVFLRTLSILAVTSIIILSNVLYSETTLSGEPIMVDSEKVEGMLLAFDRYTSTIEESNSPIAKTVKGEEDGFLASRGTQDDSSQDYKYTIQKGDSISGIAQKFDLTVATIQKANNFDPLDMENIKPGTTIIIPPYDTDNSLAWLEEINEEKAKQEQERQRKLAAERALLARSKRTVAYRDQSSAREQANSGYGANASQGLITPASYKYVSRGITRFHTGIDMVTDVGTPVVSAQDGKVVEITNGYGRGWGISVVVDHGAGLTTRYAHLSSISVGIGETVKQRQIIAYSGNTGWSTGPHLHFEARRNGSIVNPLGL